MRDSADGETWLPYGFHWKPGELDVRPAQVAPHMPRLDWQLWFAPMTPWQNLGWYRGLLARLLEGSPVVTDLLAENPFPDEPPVHIRAIQYQYSFTTPEERAETGRIWNRRELGLYTPPQRRRE